MAAKDENYHAEFSPSGADTWMVCAPALAMQRGIPNKSSSYSDEGTDAHTVFADCLSLGVDAKEFIGDVMEKGTLVTEEFTEAVQISIDVVRSRVAIWETLGYTVTLQIEQRVPIGHLTDEDDAEGTSDVVLIANKDDSVVQLEVIDLKFGKGVEVSAINNRQMQIYALGAIKKFSITPGYVTLIITQPRITPIPSVWETTITDLEDFAFFVGIDANKARAYFEVEKSDINPTEFNPGEKQCRFCRANSTCHGLAAFTEKTIGSKFEDITEEIAPTYTALLGAIELGEVFPKLAAIELWVKAVRGKVEELLNAGETVPNAKLVKGRKGHRQYRDEAEAEALLKSLRLKQDQMYTYKLVSPTQLEKTLKEFPRKWKKVAELIVQPEAGDIVVLESDPRQAVVKPKVVDMFEEIDNENEDLI